MTRWRTACDQKKRRVAGDMEQMKIYEKMNTLKPNTTRHQQIL